MIPPARRPPLSDRTQRTRLGIRIRACREDRGITQKQLAAEVGCSQPKIQKIEAGKTGTPQPDLENIIRALSIDPDTAAELRRLNHSGTPGRRRTDRRFAAPSWFRPILYQEADAVEMLSWTGERMPGLLQSEDYMRAQFRSRDRDRVAERVAERLGRQQIFGRRPDARYVFLISEGCVLRTRKHLAPAVALAQFEHLTTLLHQHEGIDLRVVPFSAAAHVDTDFTILRFDPGEVPDFAYTEDPDRLNVTRATDDTFALYEESWAALLAVALPRTDSLAWFTELAHQCRTESANAPAPEVTLPEPR